MIRVNKTSFSDRLSSLHSLIHFTDTVRERDREKERTKRADEFRVPAEFAPKSAHSSSITSKVCFWRLSRISSRRPATRWAPPVDFHIFPDLKTKLYNLDLSWEIEEPVFIFTWLRCWYDWLTYSVCPLLKGIFWLRCTIAIHLFFECMLQIQGFTQVSCYSLLWRLRLILWSRRMNCCLTTTQ